MKRRNFIQSLIGGAAALALPAKAAMLGGSKAESVNAPTENPNSGNRILTQEQVTKELGDILHRHMADIYPPAPELNSGDIVTFGNDKTLYRIK